MKDGKILAVDTRAEVKPADLVILDRNPLQVDPAASKDLRVVETIKEGKPIHRKG